MGEPRKVVRMVAVGALATLAACSVRPIEPPVDSLTVARVMGQHVEVPPLLPEHGSVWPATEDSPRGTIGNPDVGVQPSQLEGQGRNRQSRRRGSTTPPDLLMTPEPAPDLRLADPPPAPAPLNRRRAFRDGSVIPTPQGPAITTGGGAGYSTYTTPGGGSGIAIPQGGTTTLLDSDGGVRQVPTPR
ncbi:hypothetical protein [Roseomonas marmotae]|uniref:DUF3035 domain-containing protein n=1 Tax=Roseomonas marmotae TaxID=2768161 RepID=A0ABS3KG90_9PROT|nr:hypothetical protein [Roseomonas marmotae]MBO1076470.1 hypothetical protein [Roseomonas marmotae]QTI77930.1 hypothetical protein IAI58_09280 [Roseomonas marmotae]